MRGVKISAPIVPPHFGRGGDDRQRRRLALGAARLLLPDAGPAPPAHPPLTAHRPTARPSASSAPCLAEWAYGAIYATSRERTNPLEGWRWRYNFKRNHGPLGRKPP